MTLEEMNKGLLAENARLQILLDELREVNQNLISENHHSDSIRTPLLS